MMDRHREIQDLLVDYAGALRDGCIPDFLKSLTRTEAATIQEAYELPEALEMIRVLNAVSFASQAVTPSVGLFTARVDAKIALRQKQAKGARPSKRPTRSRSQRSEIE